MQQTAEDPNKMRNIYDQVGSAQGGTLDRAQSMAPIMDRSGGHFGGNKKIEPPRLPKFEDAKKPDKKDIDIQVDNIVSNIPKKDPPKSKDSDIKLDDVERATGNVRATDKFYGATKRLTTPGAGIDRDKKITPPKKTSTPTPSSSSSSSSSGFGSSKFGGFSIPKFFGGK